MAGRESRGTGGISKQDKEEKEIKQRTNKENGKKVTFRVTGDKEETSKIVRMKEEIIEVINKEIEVGKDNRKKIRGDIEEINRKIVEIEERFRTVEGELEELKERDKLRASETETQREGSETQEEIESVQSGRRSRCSFISTRSVGNESRFSDREIGRLKKWVTEKDKEERKNNIVIKGVKMPRELEGDRKGGEKWIEDLIKTKLGVDMKAISYRVSGTVVVVKLENEEKKKESMINKSGVKNMG